MLETVETILFQLEYRIYNIIVNFLQQYVTRKMRRKSKYIRHSKIIMKKGAL